MRSKEFPVTFKEVIPDGVFIALPSMVRNEVMRLPEHRQKEFLEEYRRKAKSTFVAYLLWFLGWHYAYLRQWGLQFVYWLTFGGLLIWALVDAFRIPRMVRDYNKDVAVQVMRDLLAIMAQE